MQHIAIIGARGALGSDLMKVFREGWKVTDEEIDRVIKKLEEGWGW